MQYITVNRLQRSTGDIGEEIYLIDPVGGAAERVILTKNCVTLKSVRYKFAPVVLIKESMNERDK